jgi:hypothetical protein
VSKFLTAGFAGRSSLLRSIIEDPWIVSSPTLSRKKHDSHMGADTAEANCALEQHKAELNACDLSDQSSLHHSQKQLFDALDLPVVMRCTLKTTIFVLEFHLPVYCNMQASVSG